MLAHSNKVMFISNNTQFMSMPLVEAPYVCILCSPLVKKNNLQGSILKRWVFCIEIKMLKQTKNKTKSDSKTWCNLHNKVWQVVSISIKAYRHQNWVTHQPPSKELEICFYSRGNMYLDLYFGPVSWLWSWSQI